MTHMDPGHRHLQCERQTAMDCRQTFYLKAWSWLRFCCHLVHVCFRSSMILDTERAVNEGQYEGQTIRRIVGKCKF